MPDKQLESPRMSKTRATLVIIFGPNAFLLVAGLIWWLGQ
jgi:hypothetical protein